METLLSILRDYGVWGLVLVVLLYIILKSQISFRYPNDAKKGSKRE